MNDTIEATDLYAMVFSEDCKCESPTHNGGRVSCSGNVAALLLSCQEPVKVCTNMANEARRLIFSDMTTCSECDEIVSDCWKVVAI